MTPWNRHRVLQFKAPPAHLHKWYRRDDEFTGEFFGCRCGKKIGRHVLEATPRDRLLKLFRPCSDETMEGMLAKLWKYLNERHPLTG